MDPTSAKPSMDKIFGPIAAIVFTLALIVHVISIIGIDVQHYFPPVMLIHLLIFVCFVPFVLSINKRGVKRGKAQLSELLKIMPSWTLGLGIALFIYALINFLVSMSAAGGGTPAFSEGQYILHRRGELMRVLTKAEYHHAQASILRAFSGHWLIFGGIPTLYFFFSKPHKPKP